MAYAQLNVVLKQLRRLTREPGASVDDSVLLERFVRQRDEAAFEHLVWRHGPMVLSQARRLLCSPTDAEDVVQATFLTLVRKANSISKRESIASWLYKVGYRIALRARVRRAKFPVTAGFLEHIPTPVEETVDTELRSLLDKAIFRLPEKYRTAIVLCHLEGKSVVEVAAQLGCPMGTISARLTRGRELLRKRLSRNGAVLSSSALAILLSHEATSAAVPTAVVRSTFRSAWALTTGQAAVGSVPPSVAVLIDGAGAGAILSKLVLGAAVVLAGFLAIGASGLARRDAVPPPPPGERKSTGPRNPSKQADPTRFDGANFPAPGTVVVKGRVLNPDGKPVVGARLYFPRRPKTVDAWATDYGEIETQERGATDPDGRFRIELQGPEIPPDQDFFLVAAAEGFGLDGTKIHKGESPADLTLRLVRDQPIDGKIVNTEGRPLSGVEVIVQGVLTFPQERLDGFLEAWRRDWLSPGGLGDGKYLHLPGTKMSRPFKTDKDGEFKITGVGTDRAAHILIRGPGIAQAPVFVLARDGIDPDPYNRAAQNHQMQDRGGPPPVLYGPKFTHVVTPGRILAGVVRESGSPKPVAGVVVKCYASLGNGFRAVSDAQGKYQLTGLPQRKMYRLHATPDPNCPLLRRDVEVAGTAGQEPIHVDMELARGITVSGRLIDRATGEGVRGFVQFSPGGSFEQDSLSSNWTESRTDDSGSFQLKVLRGKGVLWGQASPMQCGVGEKWVVQYRRARIDPVDRRVRLANFYETLDVPEGVRSLTRDCYLDRGKTVSVQVQDPDGEPLSGTMVVNLAEFGNNAVTFAEAECPVYALAPTTPRLVLFYHAARDLISSLTLRGDEKEPLVARLVPAGAVIGRVLDRDGQSLADADIYPRFQERGFDELYWKAQNQERFRTDKEGRFRLRGIPPNAKLATLEFQKAREQFVAEPWKKPACVAPGETLDLGDVHAKLR
jgi:RNA polymerase sigma factor (sigma-70 family)